MQYRFLKNLAKPPKDLRCPKRFRRLRDRCLASIRSFQSEGEVTHTLDGDYVFQDNGGDVLAIAHLDTVQPHFRHFGSTKGHSDIIYNAQLDDRLGAWIALDVLPSLGVKVDVLLTEGEESCRSTAAHFEAKKDYNWLVEFDREGCDVVMYDYETPELVALLEDYGNEVGQGSYSDIAATEHLGVAGFNWATGLYNGHCPDACFSASQCRAAIVRFVEFYNAHKDVKISHIPYWSWEEDQHWNEKAEEEEWEYDRLWREDREFRQWELDNWETVHEYQK